MHVPITYKQWQSCYSYTR